jgi:hypothetical protein
MGRKFRKKARRRSQRVAAWIYEVVNPIVEGLERELYFLQTGNGTWRYFSQRCEFIRPVQEYVDGSQWPTYSDFLVEHPEFRKRFQSHDRNLDAVNQSASAIFGALLGNNLFIENVNTSYQAYEERRIRDSMAPDLSHMKRDLPKIVAEYLINGISDLPTHYAAARFWGEASNGFLEFLKSIDFSDHLRSAEKRLAAQSQKLITDLEIIRSKFAGAFDLPAARPSDLSVNR